MSELFVRVPCVQCEGTGRVSYPLEGGRSCPRCHGTRVAYAPLSAPTCPGLDPTTGKHRPDAWVTAMTRVPNADPEFVRFAPAWSDSDKPHRVFCKHCNLTAEQEGAADAD